MTSSGLTYDPKTGLALLPPDGSNPSVGGTARTLPTLNGSDQNGVTAPAGDPFSIFAGNITKLLSSAQQTANPAPLYAQKDAMTNEALNLANPLNETAYKNIFAGMTPNASLNAQGNTENAFSPGITSINDQIKNANDLTTNFENAANTAYQYNKPVEVGQGSTLTTQGGQVLSRGQQVIPNVPNPNNGYLPDTMIVNPDGSTYFASQGQPKPSTIGGADFTGQSTSTQPYATDPNYMNGVNGAYQSIVNSVPTPNAQVYDQYIQGHVKGSPISGSMLMTAASTNKIDPSALAAQLQWESDFGTSNVAKENNNPMGVVWAGQKGATQGTARPASEGGYYAAFPSMQQGLNAGAAIHAKYVPGNPAAGAPTQATTQPQSKTGGDFNTAYASRVASLPTAIQGFADAGPAGVAYINDERVPSTLKTSVQTMASRAGIPYLAAADVASLQSLMQAQQNMNLMKTTATNTLGDGFWGGIENIAATGLNHLTFGNALPSYNQFNSYASAAIGQLKGLVGSGGGFRITQSEIDTAQANTPESTDTLSNARTKMQVLQGLINTTISKIFPDAPIAIIDKNGNQLTIPAKNYSAAVNLGAHPQ